MSLTLPQARKAIKERIKNIEQERYELVKANKKVPQTKIQTLINLYHVLDYGSEQKIIVEGNKL